MRSKCAVCGLEVEKTKEQIQELKKLSKTGKVRPERILKLENIYEGDCEDGEEHTFSWDIEFLKEVEGLKGKHKGISERKVGDEKELEKTKAELIELRRKLEEGEKKEKDLVVSIDSAIPQIKEVEVKFEEITGTKDLSEWA